MKIKVIMVVEVAESSKQSSFAEATEDDKGKKQKLVGVLIV